MSNDTLIQTSAGLKTINSLEIGDEVICLDHNLASTTKSITAIEEVEVESFIKIVTEDNTILHLSSDQKLFVPYKWVQADQLSLGDLLLKQDNKFVRIKKISHKQLSLKLRFITVDHYQNFLITNNSILVHNGLKGASSGFWLGKFAVNFVGHGTMAIIAACTGPAAPVTMAALEATFLAPLEAASNLGGLAVGMTLAVATGPV